MFIRNIAASCFFVQNPKRERKDVSRRHDRSRRSHQERPKAASRQAMVRHVAAAVREDGDAVSIEGHGDRFHE